MSHNCGLENGRQEKAHNIRGLHKNRGGMMRPSHPFEKKTFPSFFSSRAMYEPAAYCSQAVGKMPPGRTSAALPSSLSVSGRSIASEHPWPRGCAHCRKLVDGINCEHTKPTFAKPLVVCDVNAPLFGTPFLETTIPRPLHRGLKVAEDRVRTLLDPPPEGSTVVGPASHVVAPQQITQHVRSGPVRHTEHALSAPGQAASQTRRRHYSWRSVQNRRSR